MGNSYSAPICRKLFDSGQFREGNSSGIRPPVRPPPWVWMNPRLDPSLRLFRFRQIQMKSWLQTKQLEVILLEIDHSRTKFPSRKEATIWRLLPRLRDSAKIYGDL